MNIIVKKIEKCYFNLIDSGDKNYEIRKEDDCTYYVNDILILKEIDILNKYTGRIAICRISSVIRGFEGLVDGYVALGIKVIKTHDLTGAWYDSNNI